MLFNLFSRKPRSKVRLSGKRFNCQCCGAVFWITPIEITFYICNEKPLPQNCRLCQREGSIQDKLENVSEYLRVGNLH